MRKTVLGSDSTPTSPTASTLLSALPSDLRAVLKAITKYTNNTGGDSNTADCVTATTDYLPLLAEFEVAGSCEYANTTEQNYQKQYAYYTAGNSKVKNKHNATTTGAKWWLRSALVSNVNYCIIGATGNQVQEDSDCSLGVSPLFAV